MKNILVAGAGKSSTSLIKYFLKHSADNNWKITVMDASLEAIKLRIGDHPNAVAEAINIFDHAKRKNLVAQADIILSVMPPDLHFLLAEDCIEHGKHLITSSYVSENIKQLDAKAKELGILFMCEMGCDPGIDHMSTAKIFDEIKQEDGKIEQFRSYCGGLVAPESDNNAWHYKISWNPYNVVTAAKAGAMWLENDKVENRNYEEMFHKPGKFNIKGLTDLVSYPNRDSIKYKEIFSIPTIHTFERATLRHKDYMHGWSKIVDLKLTDEVNTINIEQLTYKQWLANAAGCAIENIEETLVSKYGFNDTTFKLFNELELLSDQPIALNKKEATNAQILQAVIEHYWKLEDTDKDMIVMQHLVNYTLNEQQYEHESSLIVIGKDNLETAMAMTVGLPMAILGHLILDNKIDTQELNGVQIPIQKTIYEQVLPLLEKEGIQFEDEIKKL